MISYFEAAARKDDFYSDELMRNIVKMGSVQHMDEIPAHIKKAFVTAHDINPEWHIRMQAAFQKHTDNAVSKTVNFPNDATMQDVEKVFMLAFKLGCKGVTVYRDRSRDEQVLYIETVKKKATEEKKYDLEYSGGCTTCTI